MSKFKVMQILLSDEQIDEINAKGWEGTDFGLRYSRATMFPKQEAIVEALREGDYTEVAEIEADSLEQVFHIGNMGPQEKITLLGEGMKSVSVGDIVIDPNGVHHYVDSYGFKEVFEG